MPRVQRHAYAVRVRIAQAPQGAYRHAAFGKASTSWPCCCGAVPRCMPPNSLGFMARWMRWW